jgi:SpoVK/Ycf46/Vps4 family AAA+-type ATPase
MLVFHESPGGPGAGKRATPEEVVSALSGLMQGPRRREIAGHGGRPAVIAVAAMRTPWSLDPRLRESLQVLRFELPDRPELEKLLVRDVVGRYMPCDLDRISFATLASQAAGMVPSQLERVARRAKLAALDRRSRELGTRLRNAPERLRGRIRSTYLITHEDLSGAIAEERRVAVSSGSAGPAGAEPAPPVRQTDITGWNGPGLPGTLPVSLSLVKTGKYGGG